MSLANEFLVKNMETIGKWKNVKKKCIQRKKNYTSPANEFLLHTVKQ